MRLLQKRNALKNKKYPLKLFFCNDCNHVQLTDIVDPRELFQTTYTYQELHQYLLIILKNYAKKIIKDYSPDLNKYVLDIGSNDGTLLKFFKKWDIK